MRVRFASGADPAEREAVAAALSDLGVPSEADGDELRLLTWLAPEDAVAVAAMPGVRDVTGDDPHRTTLRDAMLRWLSGAALVMGVLTLVASNFPPELGEAPDPLSTPSTLRPPWPLLPWYAAVDRAPPWVPVWILPIAAVSIPFLWPLAARRFAERRPGLHTLLGVVAIVAAVLLAAWEMVR
jgi:hypothetical protein